MFGRILFATCGLTFSIQSLNSLFINHYFLYFWNYNRIVPFPYPLSSTINLSCSLPISVDSLLARLTQRNPPSPPLPFLDSVSPNTYGLGSHQSSLPSVHESHYCHCCDHCPPSRAPLHTILPYKFILLSSGDQELCLQCWTGLSNLTLSIP